MAYPRVKFNRPFNFQLAASRPELPDIIIEPVKGFNRSQPLNDLEPGETGNSENYIVEDGFLRPRSGLSQFGDNQLADVGLLAIEHRDVVGQRFPVIASPRTAAFFSTSWSTLSYVIRGSGQAANDLSGDSSHDFFATSVYEPVVDENILVFSNFHDVPKIWQPSQTTFSDLSDFISVESFGKIPYTLDNRLCFFNCASSLTTFGTRVRFSERGLTSNFSTRGAGFEDLMDMAGVGQGVTTRENDAILFSSEEVWLQRPLRSVFAFQFTPIQRSLGCPYPRTIARTPIGVIFLTREFEPYAVVGNQVQPIGKKVHQHLRDIMTNPEFAFGLYNSKQQRYELYFNTASETERASHALYLDLDSGAWMPINTFDFEVSAGAEVGSDLGLDIIWDNVTQTWDEIAQTWDNMVESTSRDKEVMVVSSNGTSFRFRDGQFTDTGSVITAFWESHTFNNPTKPGAGLSLYETIIDYDATNNSALSFAVRGNQVGAFDVQENVTLEAASDSSHKDMKIAITGLRPQFRIQTTDTTARARISRFITRTRSAGRR